MSQDARRCKFFLIQPEHVAACLLGLRMTYGDPPALPADATIREALQQPDGSLLVKLQCPSWPVVPDGGIIPMIGLEAPCAG